MRIQPWRIAPRRFAHQRIAPRRIAHKRIANEETAREQEVQSVVLLSEFLRKPPNGLESAKWGRENPVFLLVRGNRQKSQNSKSKTVTGFNPTSLWINLSANWRGTNFVKEDLQIMSFKVSICPKCHGFSVMAECSSVLEVFADFDDFLDRILHNQYHRAQSKVLRLWYHL